jgi:hypothetical protein
MHRASTLPASGLIQPDFAALLEIQTARWKHSCIVDRLVEEERDAKRALRGKSSIGVHFAWQPTQCSCIASGERPDFSSDPGSANRANLVGCNFCRFAGELDGNA